MKVYTADEVRFVEERENEIGTSFIRLMENAGGACAKRVEKYLKKDSLVVVVCGKGKNGGDGFVIARKLSEKGYNVKVVLAQGAPTAPDAIEMYHKVDPSLVDVVRYDWDPDLALSTIASANILVDSIFGIGFHGEPDAACSEVFKAINLAQGFTIAIDVPSGVNTDSGEACRYAVQANVTLAITCLKPAHVLVPARGYCGTVTVLDIGISDEALSSVSPNLETLSFGELKEKLPMRYMTAHKNNFGHALCIAGSTNMPGAACLCSGAACVAGSGLTTVAFPKSAYASLASNMREVMLVPLPDIDGKFAATVECMSTLSEYMQKANAIVLGPGLGQSSDVTEFVFSVLQEARCNVVLDADGLNALASDLSVLRSAKAHIIITPHPGEMARLTGMTVNEIEENREGIASDFAKRHGVTVVLKGPSTIVASPNERNIYVNTTGNAALAKGGSGDVLAGIIGALLAQGMTPYDAACCGAYLHGYAADLMIGDTSVSGFLAHDLFEGIRKAFLQLER